MNLRFFIMADQILQNRFDGKLSAIGLFDTIFRTVFPSQAPRFFILIGFDGTPGKGIFKASIEAPDNTTLLSIENIPLKIETGTSFTVMNFDIQGMPVTSPGQFSFKLRQGQILLLDKKFYASFPPVPQFTELNGEELNRLRANNYIIPVKKMRCPSCGKETAYRLAEFEADRDSLPLPEDLVHRCSNCHALSFLAELKHQLLLETRKILSTENNK